MLESTTSSDRHFCILQPSVANIAVRHPFLDPQCVTAQSVRGSAAFGTASRTPIHHDEIDAFACRTPP